MSMSLTNKTEITCENCNLDSLCIPKGLQPADIVELGVLVNRNNLRQKGETIYHAGSPFRGVIALRSGSAKLVNIDKNGVEFIVAFILPGELLGFDGVATQIHNCTAVALETVNFCHLAPVQVELLAHKSPTLSHALFQRSCDQFDSQVLRAILARRAAEDRVAHFILDVSDRLKARGYSELEFRLSMSREEIGNHLGIALETVSRIINHFQTLKMIEVKAKHLKIIDKKKLLSYCAD